MNLDAIISKKLRDQFEAERAAHTPSGKLSGSQLGKPLLEQVLKIIGVPEKPVDDYVLRLFERGKQVEAWIVSFLDGEEQEEIDYKGCIGFIDKMIDGVPVEVKSVKSSQWKWLEKQGAKWPHKLQATLYALATGASHYQILYVASDDFRTFVYEGLTEETAPDVEKIIKEVKTQLISGELPAFEPREDWQGADNYSKYSSYPEFISLSPDLALQKLKNQYPQSYGKLKSYKDKVRQSKVKGVS